MDEIIWRPVVGYENIYEVSNTGLVRSLNHFVEHSDGKHRIQKGRVLKTSISNKGYVQVSLSYRKNKFHTGVHRLVAAAFVGNPENKNQVNHKDGDKSNNLVDNLEWCTNQENVIHAVQHNLNNPNFGEKHHNCRLTNKQIIELKRKLTEGQTGASIAREYKMSAAAVSKINKGKTYKNIG